MIYCGLILNTRTQVKSIITPLPWLFAEILVAKSPQYPAAIPVRPLISPVIGADAGNIAAPDAEPPQTIHVSCLQ